MSASLDAVHRIAGRLRSHLRTEVDVEFALPAAGGAPVILQCRPLTHVRRGDVSGVAEAATGTRLVGRSCASGRAAGVATGGDGTGITVMEQVTTADYGIVLRCAGVVTERDASPLNHVAILCRELGIPFICGVSGARAQLLGRRVAIDGTAGEIEILDDTEPVPARPAAPLPPGEPTLSAVELALRLLAEGRPGHPPAAEAERIGRRYARALGGTSFRVVRHPIAPAELERLDLIGAELFGPGFSTPDLFHDDP
jgi:phosphohistidine swiveling domain-containing protein